MIATKKKASVLILDDDPDLVEAIAGVLDAEGVEVRRRATRSVRDVVALKPDLVMIDCPPGAKAEVLKFVQQMRLRRDIAHIPILLGVPRTPVCSTRTS
jgi:DNA-binding response OmpR family regulator